MEPRVIVGILTWNQKADVVECLRSVIQMDYPNFEVVVVDNGSTDGTEDAIHAEFPQVTIVRNQTNTGCAEGVNGQLRYALQENADYLFTIANDAVVDPRTLTELIKVAKTNPELGTFFPKVYYYGTNKIWFAKGISLDGGIDWLRGRFRGYVQNVEDTGQYDEECGAEIYPGGFCMVNVQAVRKVGLLNPDYFIYFDDSEWLMRIARAGYRGKYVPKARAWHKASSSLGMETPSFYYYRTRNRFYFFREFSPPWIFPFFIFYFTYEFLTKTWPRLYLSKMHAQWKAVLIGVRDFVRGRMGSRTF